MRPEGIAMQLRPVRALRTVFRLAFLMALAGELPADGAGDIQKQEQNFVVCRIKAEVRQSAFYGGLTMTLQEARPIDELTDTPAIRKVIETAKARGKVPLYLVGLGGTRVPSGSGQTWQDPLWAFLDGNQRLGMFQRHRLEVEGYWDFYACTDGECDNTSATDYAHYSAVHPTVATAYDGAGKVVFRIDFEEFRRQLTAFHAEHLGYFQTAVARAPASAEHIAFVRHLQDHHRFATREAAYLGTPPPAPPPPGPSGGYLTAEELRAATQGFPSKPEALAALLDACSRFRRDNGANWNQEIPKVRGVIKARTQEFGFTAAEVRSVVEVLARDAGKFAESASDEDLAWLTRVLGPEASRPVLSEWMDAWGRERLPGRTLGVLRQAGVPLEARFELMAIGHAVHGRPLPRPPRATVPHWTFEQVAEFLPAFAPGEVEALLARFPDDFRAPDAARPDLSFDGVRVVSVLAGFCRKLYGSAPAPVADRLMERVSERIPRASLGQLGIADWLSAVPVSSWRRGLEALAPRLEAARLSRERLQMATRVKAEPDLSEEDRAAILRILLPEDHQGGT